MYKYKFIRFDLERSFVSGDVKDETKYQEIIEEHAKKGWRLVQIFAPPIFGHGNAKYFELIFEKPK
ncbi:MAG: DUF4177 domain-containing protein [bacterium]|nr:DUF4177 domain-containing protein [bacterium]